MRVAVDGVLQILPADSTVRDATAAFSPFGNEPVTVILNGVRVDANTETTLSEGDDLHIYPLLIGG